MVDTFGGFWVPAVLRPPLAAVVGASFSSTWPRAPAAYCPIAFLRQCFPRSYKLALAAVFDGAQAGAGLRVFAALRRFSSGYVPSALCQTLCPPCGRPAAFLATRLPPSAWPFILYKLLFLHSRLWPGDGFSGYVPATFCQALFLVAPCGRAAAFLATCPPCSAPLSPSPSPSLSPSPSPSPSSSSLPATWSALC